MYYHHHQEEETVTKTEVLSNVLSRVPVTGTIAARDRMPAVACDWLTGNPTVKNWDLRLYLVMILLTYPTQTRFAPWPDDSRNVWFVQAYRTICGGWFAQKRGWFTHWRWWFAQARFLSLLRAVTKYIWDDVFSAYIALKCSVTDNWHEWVVCDRDSKPCGVLWFTHWPMNITVKPDSGVWGLYTRYSAWIEYHCKVLFSFQVISLLHNAVLRPSLD